MDNGIQTLHGVLANLRAEQVRLVRVCVSFIALTFTQEKKDLHLKSVRVDANGVVLPEWAERYEYWTQRRAECDALINATSTFCLLHTHTHTHPRVEFIFSSSLFPASVDSHSSVKFIEDLEKVKRIVIEDRKLTPSGLEKAKEALKRRRYVAVSRFLPLVLLFS
jgi:hypothetical protein